MIREILTSILDELQKALRAELKVQGHVLSGKLSQSIEYEISIDGNEAVGRMYFEEYGLFVETGVSADRIPFGGSGGSGGTSKYIQGLISFWEGRGLSGRDAIGAAFATAQVHKREGMPSRASYRFSSSGERTGFVRTVIEDNTERIGATISELYGAELKLQFAEDFSNYENIRFEA